MQTPENANSLYSVFHFFLCFCTNRPHTERASKHPGLLIKVLMKDFEQEMNIIEFCFGLDLLAMNFWLYWQMLSKWYWERFDGSGESSTLWVSGELKEDLVLESGKDGKIEKLRENSEILSRIIFCILNNTTEKCEKFLKGHSIKNFLNLMNAYEGLSRVFVIIRLKKLEKLKSFFKKMKIPLYDFQNFFNSFFLFKKSVKFLKIQNNFSPKNLKFRRNMGSERENRKEASTLQAFLIWVKPEISNLIGHRESQTISMKILYDKQYQNGPAWSWEIKSKDKKTLLKIWNFNTFQAEKRQWSNFRFPGYWGVEGDKLEILWLKGWSFVISSCMRPPVQLFYKKNIQGWAQKLIFAGSIK